MSIQLFNLEGQPMEVLPDGSPIPEGRWTTPTGGFQSNNGGWGLGPGTYGGATTTGTQGDYIHQLLTAANNQAGGINGPNVYGNAQQLTSNFSVPQLSALAASLGLPTSQPAPTTTGGTPFNNAFGSAISTLNGIDFRNLSTEGAQTLATQLALAPAQLAAYQQFAPQYAQTDMNTLNRTLYGSVDVGQFLQAHPEFLQGYIEHGGENGGQEWLNNAVSSSTYLDQSTVPWGGGMLGMNRALTQAANAQTVAGNTALRQGNITDAANMGGDALRTLQTLNPNQYTSLNMAQLGAGVGIGANQYQNQLGQAFSGGPQYERVGGASLGTNFINSPQLGIGGGPVAQPPPSNPGIMSMQGGGGFGGGQPRLSNPATQQGRPFLLEEMSAGGGGGGAKGDPYAYDPYQTGVNEGGGSMFNVGGWRDGKAPGGPSILSAGDGGAMGSDLSPSQFAGPVSGPMAVQSQANPLLSFASMQAANGGPSMLGSALQQSAMDQLALGSGLSEEQKRNATQAAREGWAARGLINSNGAVGEEALRRDAYGQQLLAQRQGFAQNVNQLGMSQQGLNNQYTLGVLGANATAGGQNLQAQQSNQSTAAQLALANQQNAYNTQLASANFGQQAALANQGAGLQAQQQNFGLGTNLAGMDYSRQQQNYGNRLANAQLQSANRFDPFATITSAGTANQGTNTGLFGQGGTASSGGLGNQNVQSMFQPFNAYSSDLYGSNYSAMVGSKTNAANNSAATRGAWIGAAGNAIGGLLGCWIARTVYGEDNPRWRIFRTWMMTQAPAWFRELYMAHGESFADFIKDKPDLKDAIRGWMDARLKEYAHGEPTADDAFSFPQLEIA